MKISIPSPCHEDWDKMTPKEQGSFCGSCAKIVVDFTKMKREEIKQYFLDKKEEKTCGRFTASQLSVPLVAKSRSIFLPKFAFALYLAFGLTLFSCAQNTTTDVIGEIEPIIRIDSVIISQDTIMVDTNTTVDIPINDCNPIHPKNFVKGDVIAEPIEPTLKGNIITDPIEYMLGEPAIETIEDEVIEKPIEHPVKMGKIKIEN